MAAPFLAYPSRWRSAAMLLGALAFVAAGAWFLADAESIAQSSRRALLHDPLVVRLVGGAALLFFGAGALVFAGQLARAGTPLIEVDVQGILWRRWADAPIPWSAIREARVLGLGGQRFLSLWLHDPAAHRSQKLLGALARVNRGMGFGDVSINLPGADRSFDALVAAVAAHAPGLFARR